jgi:cytochrome c6
VLAYSAGSDLLGSARGDSVWLFGLEGTLGPVQAGTPASRQAAPPPAAVPARAANLAEGRRLFTQTCAACHGDAGKGGHAGGAPLDTVKDLDAAIRIVTEGRNTMPPFRAAFTPDQIHDVSAFVVEELAGPGR